MGAKCDEVSLSDSDAGNDVMRCDENQSFGNGKSLLTASHMSFCDDLIWVADP